MFDSQKVPNFVRSLNMLEFVEDERSPSQNSLNKVVVHSPTQNSLNVRKAPATHTVRGSELVWPLLGDTDWRPAGSRKDNNNNLLVNIDFIQI